MPQTQQVALCVTCVVDQVLPEIGVAALRLLRRAGFSVQFPAAQTCCGQPFFNSGFRDQAADLARRTVEIFEPYEAVVLPSGSCATMIRVEYPHLLEPWPDWHRRALDLADRTYELSQFLTGCARWEPASGSVPVAVTYHDSCHAGRLLGLREEPRRLLEQAGCTLCEMDESDRCCGFGGLFSIRMPEVSGAMTTEKLRQATDTDAGVLVTVDPGCLVQMRRLAQGLPLRVEHLAILLEERTR